jgi:hypothetical protein
MQWGSLLEKYNVAALAELPDLARLQATLQGEQSMTSSGPRPLGTFIRTAD